MFLATQKLCFTILHCKDYKIQGLKHSERNLISSSLDSLVIHTFLRIKPNKNLSFS